MRRCDLSTGKGLWSLVPEKGSDVASFIHKRSQEKRTNHHECESMSSQQAKCEFLIAPEEVEAHSDHRQRRTGFQISSELVSLSHANQGPQNMKKRTVFVWDCRHTFGPTWPLEVLGSRRKDISQLHCLHLVTLLPTITAASISFYFMLSFVLVGSPFLSVSPSSSHVFLPCVWRL